MASLLLYLPHSQTASLLQIYVGVLVKYVNFGKGWRHRLFVLKGGVLRYYKVALAIFVSMLGYSSSEANEKGSAIQHSIWQLLTMRVTEPILQSGISACCT